MCVNASPCYTRPVMPIKHVLAREWLWLITITIVGAITGIVILSDLIGGIWVGGFLAIAVGYPSIVAIRLTTWAVRTMHAATQRDRSPAHFS
jgi:hypothetical protein